MMKKDNNTVTNYFENDQRQKPLTAHSLTKPIHRETDRYKWRELGGYFRVYFRLQADGQLDIIGKIRSCAEIQPLCDTLAKQLCREFALHKNRSWDSFVFAYPEKALQLEKSETKKSL